MLIVKLRVTSVAAEYVESPAWLAVVEQVPVVTNVITKPDTVQTEVVVEANETVKPDDAVGATVKVPVDNIWLAG